MDTPKVPGSDPARVFAQSFPTHEKSSLLLATGMKSKLLYGALLTACAVLLGTLPRVSSQDTTSDGSSFTPSGFLAASPGNDTSARQSTPIFSLPSYLQTSGAQADNVVIEWNKVQPPSPAPCLEIRMSCSSSIRLSYKA